MEDTLIPREYPTGKKELLFGLCVLLSAMALCNFTIYGGFNLGFALGASLCILCSAGYLLCSRRKLRFYPAAILALCLVIAASFARSDDGFVKFVMLCFLTLGSSLGLCLLAGQNRRNPGRPGTLGDAFFTIFRLGFGEMSPAYRGIKSAFRRSGSIGQKSTAVLAGVAIAVPILAVMIPLLIWSDAAFEGLMDRLPEFSFSQLFLTVLFGGALACMLYTQGTALVHYEKGETPSQKPRKGLASLTVNTVLAAVCLVYCVYLVSQLAYFMGGFAGILPQGYTLSQYARRGFFEIAWLCAINLGIIALSLGLNRQKDPAPKSTRLLCLFIALVTEFLVATASAKMFLYIGSYGLTRLRVLTEVIMFWLALTTVLVTIRLFLPGFGYMKAVVLTAMLLGTLVLWADVNTLVASYNVKAYRSGKLETVDVRHIGTLGAAGVPWLLELAEDKDPQVAAQARDILDRRSEYRGHYYTIEDFRGWNYIRSQADQLMDAYMETSE